MNDTSANDISEYVKAGDISKARELHLQVARTSAKWSGKAGVCGVKKAMDRYGFRGELPELPFTRQNTIYSMLLKPLWHMPFGFNYAHSCERDYVAKRSRPVRAYRRRLQAMCFVSLDLYTYFYYNMSVFCKLCCLVVGEAF